MKLKVKNTFKDKLTGKIYPVGATIEIDDAERVADIVERNLAEVVAEKSTGISVFGAEFDKKTLIEALKGAGVAVNANLGEQKIVERIASLTEDEMSKVKETLGIEDVKE